MHRPMNSCPLGVSHNKIGFAARLLAAAATFSAAASQPNVVLHVDRSAPAGGDGTSWQKAYRDIHDAFGNLQSTIASTSAPLDCTIKIAQGEYKPDRGTSDPSSQYFLSIANSGVSVSLIGSFGGLQSASPDMRDLSGTRTVLSGDLAGNDGPNFSNRDDNSSRLLTIHARRGRISVDGLTLRGANNMSVPTVLSASPIPSLGALTLYSHSDGNSYASATTISMINCTLEENRGYYVGAGAAISGDQILIADSTFRNNKTSYGNGGALQLNLESTAPRYVTVQRSQFLSNSAYSGGAVWSGSSCSFDRTIFDSNRGNWGGGAITTAGLWSLTSCLFSRNIARDAGAVHSRRSPYTAEANHMSFVTFAHNSGWRGVVFCESVSLRSRHTLFWGNESGGNVLSIFTGNGFFWNTLVQGGKDTIQMYPGTPTFLSSTLSSDPLFVRPASGPNDPTPFEQLNYRLRISSPAIAIGSNESGLLRDLDGNLAPWPYLPADIGAYFNTTHTCLCNLSGDSAGIVDDSDFMIFAAAYDLMLLPDGANPSADLDRDGVVNDSDFSVFVGAYDLGQCP